MARFDSFLNKLLIFAAYVLVFVSIQTPAQAQHRGAPISAGGRVVGPRRMGAPSGGAIPRPRVFTGPRSFGVGPRSFGFRQGSIHIFRPRPFFRAPFFRFGVGLGFNSLWWPACAPSVGWAFSWGSDCYPQPFFGYNFENYVNLQPYENPVYVYAGGEPDLIWLFLKDGKMYPVSDYWFVNGQLHFTSFEGGPIEHVIPSDQLDVEKTIFVNTRRGFRIVVRDEPWQQYLKDYPDLKPPDLPPSQNN
jgi:hypothetical protein